MLGTSRALLAIYVIVQRIQQGAQLNYFQVKQCCTLDTTQSREEGATEYSVEYYAEHTMVNLF